MLKLIMGLTELRRSGTTPTRVYHLDWLPGNAGRGLLGLRCRQRHQQLTLRSAAPR